MRTARPLTGAFVTLFVVLFFVSVRQATAQSLPDGPDRDLVARRCSTCHDLTNLTGTTGRTRAGWSEKINDMVVLYGMNVAPEERALILDYLATYLPP